MSVDLPLELLHKILLNAAKMSSSSCRALCAVSYWTRRFALPLLYRTVSISHAVSLRTFAQQITSVPLACPQGLSFCPVNVLRHLCVSCSTEALPSIVRHCDNLTHLATHREDFMLLIGSVALSRWLVADAGTNDLHVVLFDNHEHEDWSLYHVFCGALHPVPMFNHITHLRLGNPLAQPMKLMMHNMPRLTHFAMPCGDVIGDFRLSDRNSILKFVATTSIEVFVVILTHEHLRKVEHREIEDWVCKSRKEQEKLYVVTPQYSGLELEWDAEVRDGATIWDAAAAYTRLLMNRNSQM